MQLKERCQIDCVEDGFEGNRNRSEMNFSILAFRGSQLRMGHTHGFSVIISRNWGGDSETGYRKKIKLGGVGRRIQILF